MSIDSVYGDRSMEAGELLMELCLGVSNCETAEEDIRRARLILFDESGRLESLLVRTEEGFDTESELEETLKKCTVLEKYIMARSEDLMM